MNIELALQISHERNQQWRDQAAIDHEVRKYQPFKLPNFFAPRRNKLSRKHA
jgi:hypothetical protein